MARRWQHYMTLAGNGGKALGKGVLAHMRLYFAWRFQRIARLQQSKSPSTERVHNEADMRARERQYAARKAEAAREMQRLRDNPQRQAAHSAVDDAQARYQATLRRVSRFGDPQGELTRAREDMEQAKAAANAADDPYLRAQATWAGIPGNSVDNMLVYDRQLLRDARTIHKAVSSGNRNVKLRPHYALLLQAYEDEFVHGRGLRDEDVIAFFDSYVHDSMAGFAMDATLPSDPRCIYVGGDFEARYARVDSRMEDETQAA